MLNIGLPNDLAAYRTNLGGLAVDIQNRMRDAQDAAEQIAQASTNTQAFLDAGLTADEEYAQRVAVEKMALLATYYRANIEEFTRPLRGVIGS